MRIIFKLTTRVRCSVCKRRTESLLMLMRLICELWVPLVRHFFVVTQLNSYKRWVNFLTRCRCVREGRRRAKVLLGRKSIAGCDGRWFRKGTWGRRSMVGECMICGVILARWLQLFEPRRTGTRFVVEHGFHCFPRRCPRVSFGSIDLVRAATFIEIFIISFSIRSFHIDSSLSKLFMRTFSLTTSFTSVKFLLFRFYFTSPRHNTERKINFSIFSTFPWHSGERKTIFFFGISQLSSSSIK
jgi:hypothetical protein